MNHRNAERVEVFREKISGLDVTVRLVWKNGAVTASLRIFHEHASLWELDLQLARDDRMTPDPDLLLHHRQATPPLQESETQEQDFGMSFQAQLRRTQTTVELGVSRNNAVFATFSLKLVPRDQIEGFDMAPVNFSGNWGFVMEPEVPAEE